MRSRLAYLLVAALLLVGQAGGWLHEWSHHAAGPGPVLSLAVPAGEPASGPAAPDDPADRQCLVCVGYAALALALPGLVLALVLLASRFALPAGAVLRPTSAHRAAHRARGPPARS